MEKDVIRGSEDNDAGVDVRLIVVPVYACACVCVCMTYLLEITK